MLIQLHGNLTVTLQTCVFQKLKVLTVSQPTKNILSNLCLWGNKQGIVRQVVKG